MISIQNITYTHPNKDILFGNLSVTINKHDKIALVGNNGAGKTTLLKILAGLLQPISGQVLCSATPYYVPQIFGQYNHLTVAQALQIDGKLNALQQILAGNVSDENLTILNDDWTIDERSQDALHHWQLTDVSLTQKMETLSGGQKTKVYLAGILIHQTEIVLLDEPSNHLDAESRKLLYDFIQTYTKTMVVVSHDRKLLNQLSTIYELSKGEIKTYGGNYDFYTEQKLIESNALHNDVKSKEKALRKAKEIERETIERKQKLDAKGKKKQEKAGLPTIMLNTLRNNAEKSTSKLKDKHTEKIGTIAKELNTLRNELPDADKMKLGFDNSLLHRGKVLATATNINFGYKQLLLWKTALSFKIISGQRIAIKGLNGSGKTTLIKIILGEIAPTQGTISKAYSSTVFIDQDYSLIDNLLTVYQQAQQFNFSALQEHEIKTRLNRFLFTQDYWDKPCSALSGGEKIRLVLCCITISNKTPDIIVLDEPTNNLDIQNMDILTAAINNYNGTLLVVSHDEYFLKQIKIEHNIDLS